jgi:hypothetical protein
VFKGALTVAVLWIQVGNLPLPRPESNFYYGKESKVMGWPELQWYDAIDIIGVDGMK